MKSFLGVGHQLGGATSRSRGDMTRDMCQMLESHIGASGSGAAVSVPRGIFMRISPWDDFLDQVPGSVTSKFNYLVLLGNLLATHYVLVSLFFA